MLALVHMSFTISIASKVTLWSIENDLYKSKLQYYNYSTDESGTYTLKVRVEYNAVKEVDFGDGGAVYDGYNNSDYSWSGGYLSFSSNYQGQVESSSANVTIYGSNVSIRIFDITIGG